MAQGKASSTDFVDFAEDLRQLKRSIQNIHWDPLLAIDQQGPEAVSLSFPLLYMCGYFLTLNSLTFSFTCCSLYRQHFRKRQGSKKR